jgi:putative two-component system response regulator
MKNIMIVDDNVTSLKEIASFLADRYGVRLAKSGPQAIEICAKSRPDLVLLDVRMPGFDGFDTMEKLQENPALSGIPVIFITADRDTATEVRGLKSGARDFITKPVEKSILLHRIDLHLRFTSYQRYLADMVAEMENSITTSFSGLIECRDENTGWHVVRTSQYMKILGDELRSVGSFENKLSADDLQMRVRASPLHDIGKIAISDRYLLKPDRLTNEEFEIMKTHAAIGEEILGNMYARMPTQAYLKYARIIAASHHERFDGKGYPYGLSGENIPLCGRIMAVADVYDALVCDRVYRRGMGHVQARSIIVDGGGSQFDPRVIDAFKAREDEFASLAGCADLSL